MAAVVRRRYGHWKIRCGKDRSRLRSTSSRFVPEDPRVRSSRAQSKLQFAPLDTIERQHEIQPPEPLSSLAASAARRLVPTVYFIGVVRPNGTSPPTRARLPRARRRGIGVAANVAEQPPLLEPRDGRWPPGSSAPE